MALGTIVLLVSAFLIAAGIYFSYPLVVMAFKYVIIYPWILLFPLTPLVIERFGKGVEYLFHKRHLIFNQVSVFWTYVKGKWPNLLNPANQQLLTACSDLKLLDVQNALEKGANVNCFDKAGNTPLITVLSTTKPNEVDNFHKIIQLLLTNGADSNICNSASENALYKVIIHGHVGVVPLLNNNEMLNRPFEAVTPLMKAVEIYCTNTNCDKNNLNQIIEELLDGGADPNVKSLIGDFRWTPFTYALKYQREALCYLLLEKGANPVASVEHINETTKEIFHDHSYFMELDVTSLLFQRCHKRLEQNRIIFPLPAGIEISTDEQIIEMAITEALQYQAAGDKGAVERLIEAFVQHNNTQGLACLVDQMKPQTPGYAQLHLRLVVLYLEYISHTISETLNSQSVGYVKDFTRLKHYPDVQKQVEEYQQLVILHCLKGFLSNEQSDATLAVNELKRLYQISVTEWKMEKPPAGNVNMSEVDIMGEIANDLLYFQRSQPQTSLVSLPDSQPLTRSLER